jgi:L-2-hydroxyglutarate oxidase LhgO
MGPIFGGLAASHFSTAECTMKVAIIGAGIVGLATARQIVCRYPRTQILVLEKEAGPARHQTGHNSGVLHCGLYYKPGSQKAKLAVDGIRRMLEFCEQQSIAHEVCGKLVVATEAEEIPGLHALLERGTANGLQGLELLGPEQIREREPHAAGIAAILVPQEGIVDFKAATRAMADEVLSHGGAVHYSSRVLHLRHAGSWRIDTTSGDYEADFLINCGGLYCDRLGTMAGNHDAVRIVPFRGEYYNLKPERQYLVRNLIYPVPDQKFPFLGVHFTRMIHGGIEAGPNAVLAFAREGYHRLDFSLRDMVETLTYRGFWKFFLRYPRMCWEELRRSFSKDLFCRSLQRLVPEVRVEDLTAGGAGVRAQALAPSGDLIQDFYLVSQEHAVHVLNAPSPAATASLAVADEILRYAESALTS